MRAVILAAGVGSRLAPHTDDRPKVLLEVFGESLLSRLARQLRRVGVDELIVATGHAEAAVLRALEGIPLRTVVCRNAAFDHPERGLAARAEALLAGGPHETWKLDGDLWLDDAILDRLERAPLPDDALACAVDPREGLGAEEMKVTIDRGRIVAFGKHLDPLAAHGESMGIERLGARAVSSVLHMVSRAVTAGETGLYYEDVYDRALRAGVLTALPVLAGDRLDQIDTHEDLASRCRARAAGSGRLVSTRVCTVASQLASVAIAPAARDSTVVTRGRPASDEGS